MADDDADTQTFLQKLLFYTTAFFVLLGIFSLFAFLFLVPFVIDPAFSTIFMEFEPTPVLCQTYDTEVFRGATNCSWTSCREGCTKEMFDCTQVRVSYKLLAMEEKLDEAKGDEDEEGKGSMKERRSIEEYRYHPAQNGSAAMHLQRHLKNGGVAPIGAKRGARAIRDYDYRDKLPSDFMYDGDPSAPDPTGLMGNDSEWYYIGARLYPNVKGCGYPPMLNCSIWYKLHMTPGANFSCYYSKIDPGVVITELDMAQVYLNLILALTIPIPSFIISVIYLTFAYFKIYNDEEQEVLVNEDEEAIDGELGTPVPALTSGGLTPGSETFREDLASFGHQLKVAMADEMSRESIIDDAVPPITSSNSISGVVLVIAMTSTDIIDIIEAPSEPEPAPPPREAEKATRPNALELKLMGDFV